MSVHPQDGERGARQLVELAVSCGRKYQSPQTGFVHLHYQMSDENFRDTIPLLENTLMALALFRTHSVDNVKEGRSILERLLFFQGEEGNFPVYLHEYPHCRDRYLATQLLQPLYWIQKNYGGVLGKELEGCLEKAVKKLLDYTASLTDMPYPIVLRVATVKLAWGRLLSDKELESEGEAELELLREKGPNRWWMTPRVLGEFLVGLQMVYNDIEESPWEPLWQHLADTWHRESLTYIGPGINQRQWMGEPQSNLYDLYMGYLGGGYSHRAFQVTPFQLRAALIQPAIKALPVRTLPFKVSGELDGRKWQVLHHKKFAVSVIEQLEPLDSSLQYVFHPLQIVWGDANQTHSFVCQGGNSETIHYDLQESGDLSLHFKLNEKANTDDFAKALDVTFFVDDHPTLKKTIAGKPASVFHLGDKVQLTDERLQLELMFTQKGSARFCGHVQPGNRPAQAAVFGERRFCSFDNQVCLRAVQRVEPTDIVVEIKVK